MYGIEAREAMRDAIQAIYKTTIRSCKTEAKDDEDIEEEEEFKPYDVGEKVLILEGTIPRGLVTKYRRR